VTNWYSNVFKTWQAKQLGPKPTADQLTAIHNLGARPGKQALASAMALRECGVTGAQIVMACGAPQLNKMRGFITDGLLKRLPVAPSAEGHTVYRLEVTAKGTKRIEGNVKRAAEAEAKGEGEGEAKPKAKAKAAAKAKGASKPKAKAKAKSAETPISEADKAAEGSMPVIAAEAQIGSEMLASPASNQA
jgi:hypothetical protein